MAQRYYLYGGTEEKKNDVLREWLRRYEMMNGLEDENEKGVDLKGKRYLCRMDYSEYKRKQRGGYSHRYIALYKDIDEMDLMRRDLEKEIRELNEKNPKMIIIIIGKYSMKKYPKWLNRIYEKESFIPINIEQTFNQILPFLIVENNIPDYEIIRFKKINKIREEKMNNNLRIRIQIHMKEIN